MSRSARFLARPLCAGALLLGLLPALTAFAHGARAMDLSDYQRSDGAITVGPHGNSVDPYFAMKALWVSRKLGHPASRETLRWIAWMLPRQRGDGSFSRYCAGDDSSRDAQGNWRACADADADDATLALWIEMLHEAAPVHMPKAWIASAQRALTALQSLRDARTGVYRVSAGSSTALLMDNCEIHAALYRVGVLNQQARRPALARRYFDMAHTLRLAMARAFHAQSSGLLQWTTDSDATPQQFYPHRVAHLYPWIHHVPTAGFGPMLSWDAWTRRYAGQWLQRTDDVFPWGLVALLAWQKGPHRLVAQWLEQATRLRGGAYWNVLDEALLQGLAPARLGAAS